MVEPAALRALASWPKNVGVMRALLDAADEIERLLETLKRLQAHLGCDDETILIGLDEARQDIAAALNP